MTHAVLRRKVLNNAHVQLGFGLCLFLNACAVPCSFSLKVFDHFFRNWIPGIKLQDHCLADGGHYSFRNCLMREPWPGVFVAQHGPVCHICSASSLNPAKHCTFFGLSTLSAFPLCLKLRNPKHYGQFWLRLLFIDKESTGFRIWRSHWVPDWNQV